jgi:hypothetical protein
MEPLNRAERSNAFLNFLLLFFITIGVLLTTVFFSIEVPCKNNELLQKKAEDLKYEKNRSDAFAIAMRAALNELKKFDVEGGSVEATKRSVQMKITGMEQLIKDVPNVDTSIYALVIQSLDDLNEAKAKNRNMEAINH